MANPTTLQSSCSSSEHEDTLDKEANLPLTPPATDEQPSPRLGTSGVDQVMHMFRRCRDRTVAENLEPLTMFKLPTHGYDDLLRELEADQRLGPYVEDKVRFDYEPDPGCLTIRMPSPVHDFFRTFLANEIRDGLKHVADGGGEAGEFAAKIEDGSSSRILLREGVGDGDSGAAVRREPDGQFQHEDAAYPGVVLEVSYSQDGKDLRKLATDYVLRSNGDIKAVIGIDINYGKASTASLWRPNFVKADGGDMDTLEVIQEVAYEEFRTSDGPPANCSKCLCLSLNDFATDEISGGNESVSVSISFKRLGELLARAERMHQAREPDGAQLSIKSTRRLKKRKPSSSPPEELRSEDEARYRREERSAADRAAAADEDFHQPRRRRQ